MILGGFILKELNFGGENMRLDFEAMFLYGLSVGLTYFDLAGRFNVVLDLLVIRLVISWGPSESPL
jgi:hypothetical protein